MSLIQGVWDGKEQRIPESGDEVEGVAAQLAEVSLTNEASAASSSTVKTNGAGSTPS